MFGYNGVMVNNGSRLRLPCLNNRLGYYSACLLPLRFFMLIDDRFLLVYQGANSYISFHLDCMDEKFVKESKL